MKLFMRTKMPSTLLLFLRTESAIEETLSSFTARVALLLMSGPFVHAEHHRLARLMPRNDAGEAGAERACQAMDGLSRTPVKTRSAGNPHSFIVRA
ncbi:hypothetical protein [Stenotrophobium rhamnosiphilum]|uniref:Uncharacterized protein n=1 Tax=Stenotrophobium rhamnosiphilum TaxID=2029166 RepID=A0A2T5MIQ5_9GAMM|nr:hypothetical protein [Stenotrophobium rhamnosiphilum]PTU32419.1 hypothetical protein CJD38_07155 [Stenotrophobium rhamnosiphilum]